MIKKICTAFVCAIFIAFLGINCFAEGNIIKITKPEGDESTYNKSYILCGNTDKEDVTVQLQVYNNQLENYVPLQTAEGESSFVIGDSGKFFMEAVNLPFYGLNKIQITAFSAADPDNKQVITCNIILLKENVKDRFVNGVLKVDDMINNNGVNSIAP